MLYKCSSCGRTEESNDGPPICYCGLGKGDGYITRMKPITKDKEGLNEYLIEG